SLPTELLNFWKEYGFGNYGDGIIKVINPLEYMENFYEWLGKEDFSKIPIILTAFGDAFYYRKLQDDV
ncbi:GAD-like domain-containing protein, partial [Clostridium sp. ZBS3]